ncbi:hypothetical protein RvY_03561 [Ramazzottius varieornatus]|uniref:Chromo domain-containing protein n=1 Tax=Ramazzottius varieornatus TaxID=947166 RepID=A0A1D1UPA5_RAMVA|nr:hypothetical protein RvY_03561 [Ramazzottius varieornatus]
MRKEVKIFKTTEPEDDEEQDEDDDALESNKPVDEEFEVKEILHERIEKGELLYYVFWEGYRIEESTWEPAENLAGCDEVL